MRKGGEKPNQKFKANFDTFQKCFVLLLSGVILNLSFNAKTVLANTAAFSCLVGLRKSWLGKGGIIIITAVGALWKREKDFFPGKELQFHLLPLPPKKIKSSSSLFSSSPLCITKPCSAVGTCMSQPYTTLSQEGNSTNFRQCRVSLLQKKVRTSPEIGFPDEKKIFFDEIRIYYSNPRFAILFFSLCSLSDWSSSASLPEKEEEAEEEESCFSLSCEEKEERSELYGERIERHFLYTHCSLAHFWKFQTFFKKQVRQRYTYGNRNHGSRQFLRSLVWNFPS